MSSRLNALGYALFGVVLLLGWGGVIFWVAQNWASIWEIFLGLTRAEPELAESLFEEFVLVGFYGAVLAGSPPFFAVQLVRHGFKAFIDNAPIVYPGKILSDTWESIGWLIDKLYLKIPLFMIFSGVTLGVVMMVAAMHLGWEGPLGPIGLYSTLAGMVLGGMLGASFRH